jgi:polyhydroxybutyrate depolymerase
MYFSDFRPIADTAGFILVYPQGLPLDEGSTHWNIAENGGDNKSNSDDFGFIEALINELSSGYNIDLNRIYACGYSNGAGFSFSVACHLDQFAAMASVSGLMSDWALNNCDPPEPVGVMILHGTLDDTRPYSGINNSLLSVDEAIQFWVNFNNTDSIPQTTSFNDESLIEHFKYDNGDSGSLVEHYKVNNGYHIWFNFFYEGKNTNELIWDFLSKHRISESL